MQKGIDYKNLARQYLDTQLNRLFGASQSASIEPYKPVANTGTIKTERDWAIYAAESGSGEVRIALWLARSNNPELTKLMPEIYTISRHSRKLAEEDRDQSGLPQRMIPQTNSPRDSPFEKKPYTSKLYSYRKYPPRDYLKLVPNSAKAVYNGIERKISELFSKIRSVYQSAFGITRAKNSYNGQNETPDNFLSIDAYKKTKERRIYNPPQTPNLEERLTA